MVDAVEIGIVSAYMTTDRFRGYLTIGLNFENTDEVRAQVSNALQECGIVHGIDEALIDQLCQAGEIASHILIAEATGPVDGKDGKIAYHFDVDHHIAPRTNEDGSVDYHDMGFVDEVRKDALLATITDATLGIDGMDIEGNVIKAKDGKPARIRTGKNCHKSDDGLKIYASIDGVIIYENDAISVSNVLEINEDVGVGTGDITFCGQVNVHGNIMPGMRVKCRKLNVDGIIEDARIVVSGDVEVGKGIQGHQHASIHCLGDIHSKYISNAEIYAHGNIVVDMILNSDVKCNNTITAEGRKGCIIGGKIYARGNIKAKSIGSELGVSTVFTLGEFTSLMEEVASMKKLIDDLESSYVKTEQALQLLDQKLSVNPEHVKYRELKMQYTRNKFTTQHEINKKQQVLQKQQNRLTNNGVISLASDRIFPGTHIIMGQEHLDIEDFKKDCIIRSVSGELLVEAS